MAYMICPSAGSSLPYHLNCDLVTWWPLKSTRKNLRVTLNMLTNAEKSVYKQMVYDSVTNCTPNSPAGSRYLRP